MDRPVPRKRQKSPPPPTPAPRRHIPAPPPAASVGVATSSNVSDNKSSIVESALNAKDKFNRGMLLGAKLAKQVVEHGIPSKRSSLKASNNDIVINSSHVSEEVPTQDLSLFKNIQFHSPLNENRIYQDNEAIYCNVELNQQPPDNVFFEDSSFYDTFSISNTSYPFKNDNVLESNSNSDFTPKPKAIEPKITNDPFNNLTSNSENNKQGILSLPSAEFKGDYENFPINIPSNNYEKLDHCKTGAYENEMVLYSNIQQNTSNNLNCYEDREYVNLRNPIPATRNSVNVSSAKFDRSSTFYLGRNENSSRLLLKHSKVVEDQESDNFNVELPTKSYNDPRKYENFMPLSKRNTCVNEPHKRESVMFVTMRNSSRNSKLAATKSTIVEFDPIAIYDTCKLTSKTKTNEMLLMEAFLHNYCNESATNVADNVSETSENESFDDNSDIYMSPPTPPERNDSLNVNNIEFKDELFKNALNESSTKPEWFSESELDATTPSHSQDARSKKSNVFIKRFSSMLKIVPDTAAHIRKKFDIVLDNSGKIEKPPMSKANIVHQGQMMRSLSAPMEELFKNFQMRLCLLSNKTLICYSDNNSINVKESYNLENMYSIQVIKILSANCFHFQLNYYTGSIYTSRNTVTFGCTTSNERADWMQKILLVASPSFPPQYISNFTRFGWCFVKGNISQQWEGGWILLSRRFIYYHTSYDTTIQNIDLRKAKSVVLQKDENSNVEIEEGPVMILDFQNQTLYLKMACSAETKMWKRIIKSTAVNNGRSLHQQQLTKENIPVIVQKCINFICCYGSLTEGIYRRSGRTLAINTLIDLFNKDAWELHLSQKDYYEHDIAAVMKAFFRNLPEPLIPVEHHAKLCRVSEYTNERQKVTEYGKILSSLETINKNTLRVLIGHLNFISSFSDENLMNVENLSSVWTPTLMPSSNTNTMNFHHGTQVIKDLIYLYVKIYNPSEAELHREKSILNVLRKYKEINAPVSTKPSGQFHVWIRLENGKDDDAVNVSVGPTQTCGDICKQLSSKMKMETHMLCLEEVVCEQKLRRPIHHSEIVLDIVFNWGNWDECDRKENSLFLCENKFLRKISNVQKHMIQPMFLRKEWKYADDKTKSFKSYLFELTDTTLRFYKGKNTDVAVDSWQLRDVCWYIGHESKRNPNSEWSLTLVKRKNKCARSKAKPWFGHIIAGQNTEDMMLLIACFLFSEHPHDLLPNISLIDP